MKLKTVKDLTWKDMNKGKNDFVHVKELKAEAIKWVKEKEFMTEYDFSRSSSLFILISLNFLHEQ